MQVRIQLLKGVTCEIKLLTQSAFNKNITIRLIFDVDSSNKKHYDAE